MSEAIEVTRALRAALDQTAALLATPSNQEEAIRYWEEIWTERLPETALRVRELREGLDGLGRSVTEEEAREIAGTLSKVGDLLSDLSTDRAPNPDLIALYYLRRMDKNVNDMMRGYRDG